MPLASQSYERAVTVAASLAWHFANQNAEVSFATQESGVSNDVYDFLQRLALIGPATSTAPYGEMLDAHGYNIVVTAQAQGAIPTRLWDSSFYIFVGDRH